ncbi:MAG: DivIVA domain-containing protein [Firmicutes bacterium]|nr:DivIVA domain-containing protein [Bacillota bacterium]
MLRPIDIHNAEFKRSFRGYNESEVDQFLSRIVSEYENVIQQNKELKEQIKQLEEELRQYQNKESDIYGLITLTREAVSEAKEFANQQAQTVIDEANKKAKIIIDEARLKAKQILQENQDELDRMIRRIQNLKDTELKFKQNMRQLMETIWAMLEDVKVMDIRLQEESAATKVFEDLAAEVELFTEE